jgi:hypothetical protein
MSRRTTHIATLKCWLSALVEIRNPEAIDADVDTMQVSKADVVAPTKVELSMLCNQTTPELWSVATQG